MRIETEMERKTNNGINGNLPSENRDLPDTAELAECTECTEGYQKLDRRAIKSWRIGNGINLVISIIVWLVGFIVLTAVLHDSSAKWIVSGVIGIYVLIVLLKFFVYPIIEYRQWKYMITDDRVEIEHGIFFIRRTIIPIVRIQNITVSQGPINRKLGLYNITISIASGSFEIPCLAEDVANQISIKLKEQIYKRLEKKENRL